MTARKTAKSKPRKVITLSERVKHVEYSAGWNSECIHEINKRIDVLESRERLRDKSHDEPVSNAAECIGPSTAHLLREVRDDIAQGHFTLTEVHRPWWRRLIGFMGSP